MHLLQDAGSARIYTDSPMRGLETGQNIPFDTLSNNSAKV
jgi:hypothetical protein